MMHRCTYLRIDILYARYILDYYDGVVKIPIQVFIHMKCAYLFAYKIIIGMLYVYKLI